MTSEVTAPLWLRVWHSLQALLFLGLLATGLNMHYAGSEWAVIPFSASVRAHNACGIATAALWVVFVVWNAASGHVRHYKPKDIHVVHSLVIQLRYYAYGMFRGAPPPLSPGLRNNHVQQLAYSGVNVHPAAGVDRIRGAVALSDPRARASAWQGRPLAHGHAAPLRRLSPQHPLPDRPYLPCDDGRGPSWPSTGRSSPEPVKRARHRAQNRSISTGTRAGR